MVPSTLPRRIMLPDVPRYILSAYGHRVARMTVYNWVTVGRRGVKLKLLPDRAKRTGGGPGGRLTTNIYVDEFLRDAKTGII